MREHRGEREWEGERRGGRGGGGRWRNKGGRGKKKWGKEKERGLRMGRGWGGGE